MKKCHNNVRTSNNSAACLFFSSLASGRVRSLVMYPNVINYLLLVWRCVCVRTALLSLFVFQYTMNRIAKSEKIE